MAHTMSHTEVLQCSAEDAWEYCKRSDKVLPDLLPEYFAKAEILKGTGGPGTIRTLHFGPAIPQAGAAKERLDKVDDATKTLAYTVVEGDPRYTNFTGEVQFVAKGEKETEATWTGKYDPVGDAPPPEHIKNISMLMFKTFEKASLAKKTATHSEILDASPDAIWSAVKQENSILPKALPQIFESCTVVEGNGEGGSIRLCKMGPAIPDGGEVVERLYKLLDEANEKVGYIVILGDLRFKLKDGMEFAPGPTAGTFKLKDGMEFVPGPTVGTFKLKDGMEFAPGPTAGTANATGTANYVPVSDGIAMDSKFIVAVLKALEAVVTVFILWYSARIR